MLKRYFLQMGFTFQVISIIVSNPTSQLASSTSFASDASIVSMSLSHKGISRLDNEKDFRLLLENKAIICSKSQISFLSPKVAHLLRVDPTFDEFQINIPESSECANIINGIILGMPINVPSTKIEVFDQIFFELGNDELISIKHIAINSNNAFDIISKKDAHKFDISEDIKYMASHFYELDQCKIKMMDLLILESILSSPNLVLKNEKELFKLLLSIEESRDEDTSTLFSCLHLEFLDASDISLFLNIVNNDNFGTLWPCICRRLICQVNQQANTPRYRQAILPNKARGKSSSTWG